MFTQMAPTRTRHLTLQFRLTLLNKVPVGQGVHVGQEKKT